MVYTHTPLLVLLVLRIGLLLMCALNTPGKANPCHGQLCLPKLLIEILSIDMSRFFGEQGYLSVHTIPIQDTNRHGGSTDWHWWCLQIRFSRGNSRGFGHRWADIAGGYLGLPEGGSIGQMHEPLAVVSLAVLAAHALAHPSTRDLCLQAGAGELQ